MHATSCSRNFGHPYCSCHVGKPTDPTQARDAAYRTENGFYLGDEVETPDGRRGCLDEIVVPLVRYADEHGAMTASVVRLDDEFWLDGMLTRVG